MRQFDNEGDVKAAAKVLIKQYGCYYFMPVPTGYGRQGILDFTICMNGYYIGVETKFGRNRPSANQKRELRRIADAGGIALVISETSLQQLEWVLIQIQRGTIKERWSELPQHKPGYFNTKGEG